MQIPKGTNMKVLITGTTQGIGKASAELFLQNEHEVIGFDIKPSSIQHKNYKHYQVDIFQKENLPEINDFEIKM